MLSVLRAVMVVFVLFVFGGAVQAKPVLVMAAASLKNVLEDAGEAFTDASDTKLVFSFAGSASVARQVEQGAPADIVVLADIDWMAYLASHKAIDVQSTVTLASNSLVIVAPSYAAEPLPLTDEALRARLMDGRLAIAEPENVPAGRYGKQALESLGLWEVVQEHLAPMEHVRVTLAAVARGEVPLGLVYATDAKIEERVAVVSKIPKDSHAPVAISGALTQGASDPARAFFSFLQSPEGRAVFARHGFQVSGRD
ncbi:molybdate ABC transporter substrate-binding protein [Pseudovibrio sp. SPO723]|uniref:molybdate ABC transporter substrate-binding protein n=1 Tax=Nesiotobacter zosterae TaxID=392721 RepID=UPI0029C56D51|nr:molybdate ABC transporter substrate-binding protein [Pseudovibrio sp. SPO723]MDX5594837.1 molybdate ABC transporter substrate-binding protein [Pseudovibrio sp. SPO723]